MKVQLTVQITLETTVEIEVGGESYAEYQQGLLDAGENIARTFDYRVKTHDGNGNTYDWDATYMQVLDENDFIGDMMF